MKIVIEGVRTDKGCSLKVNGVPLKHQVKHSPTGMEWGYGGSGPADTARSILMAVVVGKEIDEWMYQTFKWDFVAKWHGNSIKEFIDVDKWLDELSKRNRR